MQTGRGEAKKEEELRELEATEYIPKDTAEMSKPNKDRKPSLETRIHPYERPVRESSCDHERRQSQHSPKAHTSSSSEEKYQDQGSLNKA